MNESQNTPSNRTVVVNTLAGIGFIALIGASMWLAVYSTRYVPTVVNGAGAAAVFLGSVFTPSTASISVVSTPTTSSAISSSETNATPDTNTATEPTEPKKVAPTAGEKTTSTVAIGGTNVPVTPSGLPDLVVVINAIGYLATSSADSFIATSTVHADNRPAVNFSIKNIGTETTGAWRFSASIPTQSSYVYQSQPQQSLNPDDSIEYTLGFDRAIPGVDKMVSITANFDHAVTESNPDNNSASTQITILGS